MNLCWSLSEKNIFPIQALRILEIRLKYFQLALRRGYYGSSARYLISVFHNNDPQPSNFVYTGEDPCRLFSCLKPLFPSTKFYYISHINFYFNRFIRIECHFSIIYINQQFKCFFVTISILSHSKHSNN